jgi:predicted dehydrogenase
MVGGGSDSVIGRTHLIAARVDGFYELAAGVLSVNPEIARASARAELIVEDRAYTDYSVMAEREANRSAGIDVVTIATPPQLHLPVAREFLRRGIHVICEKPFTKDLQEAHELRKLASESGRLLCFALTANAMQGEREKCLAVGMNDYLSNPCEPLIFKQFSSAGN